MTEGIKLYICQRFHRRSKRALLCRWLQCWGHIPNAGGSHPFHVKFMLRRVSLKLARKGRGHEHFQATTIKAKKEDYCISRLLEKTRESPLSHMLIPLRQA